MNVNHGSSAADPAIAADLAQFGLDDWAPGERASVGPRKIRLHMIYLARARKTGVPRGTIFTAGTVADRDGWACTACGGPVPRRWTAAELDRAPALTFAVPWADGGRYDEANARLAHFGCAVFPDAGVRRRVGALLVRDLAVKAHAAASDEACGQGHPLTGANLLKASDGRRRCRQCRNDRERA